MFRRPRHAFLDNRPGARLDARLDDSGTATPEAAILMVLFSALALILWQIVLSEPVKQHLTDLVDQAFTGPG